MENVFSLLIETFIISQSMIKKVFLPGNGVLMGQVMLPVSDDLGERRNIGKTKQEMNMVRHQKRKMAKPGP